MYGYGFGYGLGGFDPLYLVVILVSLALGGLTQAYINATYRRWSHVRSDGATGAEVARRMLDEQGCPHVGIRGVSGYLTDHYDPRDNNLYLSEDNRLGGSVASVAVACHEAGHAVQRQRGYAFMQLRSALVPAVNVSQNVWSVLLVLGLVLNLAGLMRLAIVLFALTVLFQLVTLPVEIDASRRAVAYIESSGMSEVNVRGARRVLTAAALTYVAAALMSIIQLVYLLLRVQRREE